MRKYHTQRTKYDKEIKIRNKKSIILMATEALFAIRGGFIRFRAVTAPSFYKGCDNFFYPDYE